VLNESAYAQVRAVPHINSRGAVEHAVNSFLNSYPARSAEDAEQRAALLSEDVVFEDPVGSTPVVSRTAMLEFFKYPLSANLKITMRSTKIIVSGDEAISFTEATWGPEGAPDEGLVHVDLIHNFVIDPQGKISRIRVFYDEYCMY
jgi:ketosteroid isomerase-like protein